MTYAACEFIRQCLPIFVLVGFAVAIAGVALHLTRGDHDSDQN